MGPIPTIVLANDGIMCPLHGMPLLSWGIRIIDVAVDNTTCPLSFPTRIFGAEKLGGTWGACVTVYRCETPVSEIPVWIFGSAKRNVCVKEGFFWETCFLCLKGYLLPGRNIFSSFTVLGKDK